MGSMGYTLKFSKYFAKTSLQLSAMRVQCYL
nr:MAG TPA: hypothetical protein [Caudoviricetes sp.]